MKQALTAKGSLDVWMRSSELALENMGVSDVNVDEASQQITGMHPEKGPIAIDYMVPEDGKTRMIITVDDTALIDDYKHAVAPVFRSVVTEMQKAEAAAQEEMPPEQPADAVNDQNSDYEVYDASQADSLPDYEHQPVKRLEKEPKKKSKAPLIIVIIAIIAAVLVLGYFGWYRPNHQSSSNSSSSTQSSTSSNSSSSKSSNSNSSDNSGTASKTTNNSTTNNNSTSNNTSQNANAVTSAQYNQVTADASNGMTYDQVKALFGNKDGQQLSDATYKDESGNQIHTQVFYWAGNGGSGSNATITFSNGKATQKSQYDLK